ncbi:hypothetical protein BN1708_015572 [Verticillium longisporum]|uniref:Methyltransferase domain-containing protein n=1 Tax=Verticillium longisporum TaxID=100787 RepID=A0A0G4M611_VERLO|nr:hypothetical protein BN1708_015572 [Verticillium longisporum]
MVVWQWMWISAYGHVRVRLLEVSGDVSNLGSSPHRLNQQASKSPEMASDQSLRIYESSEAFVEKDGDWVFHSTKVIIEQGGQYFSASIPKRRPQLAATTDLDRLCKTVIPPEDIWPLYEPGISILTGSPTAEQFCIDKDLDGAGSHDLHLFRFIDGFVDEQHARVPPAPWPYVPELQVDGPNDDRQNDGLDIAHHFITLLLGDKLYEAPIDEPKRVLDVGTGTGIWAIDVADAHPAAEVTGFDISPIQPFWVPPNCKFHIDDAQLEWTYPPASFDLIHIRALYGSIADWPKLYGEAFKALKPGGYLENFEFTISLCSDAPSVRDDPKHVFKQWGQVFTEAMDRLGKTAKIGLDGRRSATWSRLASRILLSRITGSPVAAGAVIPA